MKNLEHEFDEEMTDIYRSAKEECNYNATPFLGMRRVEEVVTETPPRLTCDTEAHGNANAT
ncbi:MAG: hypothetical protein OXD30_01570 [Bryobacterales bacterium]|nr:hypothetical protein [Bryobacterales bacterium]